LQKKLNEIRAKKQKGEDQQN